MRLRASLLVLAICGRMRAEDAAAIMAKVADNVEKAAEARKQYIYHQKVRSSLVRGGGEVARREKREYTAVPGDKRTEKKLESFEGEYRKGKAMVRYDKPEFRYKGIDIDGEVMDGLVNDLVNDKNSRDGIPQSLFPLRADRLSAYKFAMKGEDHVNGRATYQIGFEPVKKNTCVNLGGDDDCNVESWKGDVWVDREELQPVSIQTQLAFKVPMGVRVFLGTNLKQTGFSVTYIRVAENVWFPAAYGTEFAFNVLWGYRRTLTLAMDSSGFQKTDVKTGIEFAK
jgi:hypothetical protein